MNDVSESSTSNFDPIFMSSDSKAVLFTTKVAVDGADHVVEVRDVRSSAAALRCRSRCRASLLPLPLLLPLRVPRARV